MKNNIFLKYFLLFAVSFSFFAYLQSFPTFPDPDSFYHAKMAVLIRDQGIITDFPWLQFTVLKDYYIDHHFLYHLTLVPFVTFLDPLVGVKLATATFGALLILIFSWLLQKFKLRGAFFYSLLLLITSPFIFRINLAKASALSVIFLLIGIYFIFNRKHWRLFFLSFAYVWLFDGWPLVFILTSLYVIADSLINLSPPSQRDESNTYQGASIKKIIQKLKKYTSCFFRHIFSKPNIKLLGACFGGLAAGVIINPYFPKNLYFYWYHIIKIAVVNYKDKIGVGAEWYPYALGDLIANDSLIFILLIITFTVFFINFIKYFSDKTKQQSLPREQKVSTLASTFFMLLFLALTLRSRRNVEYFIPFAVILSAFALNQPLSLFGKYLLFAKNWWQKRKVLASILGLFFFIMIPLTIGQNIWSLKNLFSAGYPVDKYKKISEWLEDNTPEKSIVFHNDWDDFPPLFYYNTHNYYIAGLDPTFMYDYDKDLHKEWVDITTGRRPNISEIIKNDFRSKYVFVDKDHVALENNLRSDGNFLMVYKDDEGKIYKLVDNQ